MNLLDAVAAGSLLAADPERLQGRRPRLPAAILRRYAAANHNLAGCAADLGARGRASTTPAAAANPEIPIRS